MMKKSLKKLGAHVKLALVSFAVFGTLMMSFQVVKQVELPKLTSPLTVEAPKPKAPVTIVRLHEINSGRFFCTGFVISKNLIITAAHCIDGAPEGQEIIDVRLNDKETLGIHAYFAGASGRSDQGMIHGNFSMFDSRDITIEPQEIYDIMMDQSRELVACGFPYGGKLFCTKVVNRSPWDFQYRASGILYPGMSGGPVIDVKTGKVIALNTAVGNDMILLSPLVEIFENLDVTPELIK